MGRPIKKIFIGERGLGGTSGDGEGLASVNLGGVNNSTGYTTADALTISAPDIVGGVQATGTVTIETDGELTEGQTTFTAAGTGIDGGGGAAEVLTGLAAVGNISGINAVINITKANTDLVVDYSDITVDLITTPGSLYAIDETITILGTEFGGGAGTPANDLTLTVKTFVTDGTIASTTVTAAGDGYTSVPTISADTGTQGTLTLSGVLTTTNTSVINSTAWVVGGSSSVTADMKAQKGTNVYRVTTAQGTSECELVTTTVAEGEMQIVALDSDSGTYFVRKLMNRTVILFRGAGTTGTQFADGAKVSWAKNGTAVVDYSVKITQ